MRSILLTGGETYISASRRPSIFIPASFRLIPASHRYQIRLKPGSISNFFQYAAPNASVTEPSQFEGSLSQPPGLRCPARGASCKSIPVGTPLQLKNTFLPGFRSPSRTQNY